MRQLPPCHAAFGAAAPHLAAERAEKLGGEAPIARCLRAWCLWRRFAQSLPEARFPQSFGLLGKPRGGNGVMQYSSYAHSARAGAEQAARLLKNLAPAGVWLGRRFAFFCPFRARIVRRVNERDHRLGFDRRRRRMAGAGRGVCDGILVMRRW